MSFSCKITLFVNFIYYENFKYFWNSISFNFNSPIQETWFLNENFNYFQKSAYATSWIKSLLKYDSDIQIQLIIWEIFKILKNQTSSQN